MRLVIPPKIVTSLTVITTLILTRRGDVPEEDSKKKAGKHAFLLLKEQDLPHKGGAKGI